MRVYAGNAVAGVSLHPSLTWFDPFGIGSFGALSTGLLLAVFIYWGFDTAVSVNEETRTHARPRVAPPSWPPSFCSLCMSS